MTKNLIFLNILVIISETYTNFQKFCEKFSEKLNQNGYKLHPCMQTYINMHTNGHKHSKNRARFNKMTTGWTVVNGRCMESFKQSHNATTCGLFLQLSDKNSRALLENCRTFFKKFQNFTIFPEKFQNAKNSRTIQGIPEWMATRYF